MKRILFAGSADFSLPTLEMLLEHKYVCAVLTAPDRPSGRGQKLKQNCIAQYSSKQNVPLLQPERLGAEARRDIQKYNPDILICAAFGKIFGPKFLALFPSGTVNIHPSLLPKFRGPAPIPASILAGETHTGITLQTMSLDMDCGDIIKQSKTSIAEHETSMQLLQRLALDAAQTTKELLENFDSWYSSAVPQDNTLATYCHKINSSTGRILWTENAQTLVRMARAFSEPYGGCKVSYKGQMLKLWTLQVYSNTTKYNNVESIAGDILGIDEQKGIVIKTVDAMIVCSQLQLAGRKKLPWKSFLQGESNFIGQRLESVKDT